MCGRYVRRSDKRQIAEWFHIRGDLAAVAMPDADYPEPLAELRPAVEQLAEIVDRLHLRGGDVAVALRNLTQRLVGRPATILVLGESEGAKSRFVRGLLGGSADSTPALAAGSACTYFAYGREQECAVVMEHGLTARLPADQLSEFIAQKGVAGQIRHVQVRSPNPALKDGLVVIDPPPLTVDTEAFLRGTAKARAEADACVFVLEAGRLCGEATLRLLRALKGQCGSFPFVLESTSAQMEAGHAVELTLTADALQRYGGIPRPSITVLSSSAETPAAVGSGRRRPPLRAAEYHTALLAVACTRRQESTCVEAARIADEVLGQAEAALYTRETSPLRRAKLRRERKPVQELRDLTEALVTRCTVLRQAAEAKEDAMGNRERPAARAKETRIPGPPVADPIPVPSPVPPTADNPRVGPEAPQPVARPSSAAESLAPASDAAGTACDADLATEPNTGLGLARDETRPLRSAAPEPLHSDVPVAPFPGGAGAPTRASDVAASTGPDTGLGTEPNTDPRAARNEATPVHSDAPVAAPEPLHSLNRGTGTAPVARWEETGLQSAAPPPERGASRRDPMRVRVRWASNVEAAASPSRLLLEDLGPERASPIGFVLGVVGVVAVAACAWLFFVRPDIISNSTRPVAPSQASSQAPGSQSASGNLSAPLPSIDTSSDGIASSSTTGDQRGVNPDGTLQAALMRWVSTFRSRDINAQVACYSPHVRTYFQWRNVTREQIRYDKTRAWSRIASIRKYTVTPLSITDEGSDRRAMLLRKHWDTITTWGTISSGDEIERLIFRKLAGDWKIVDEQEIKGSLHQPSKIVP
jgi:hypothetical protein